MQPSAENIWGAAQQLLRTMLNTDIFNLWFLPIKATTLENDTLTLEVANDFCEVWLKDNYLGLNTFRELQDLSTPVGVPVAEANKNPIAHARVATQKAPGRGENRRRQAVLQSAFPLRRRGFGKTHLLHAIGQHVAGKKKGARVTYLSSERFTNEYIDAIQNNQLVRFPPQIPPGRRTVD
jgi:chromosomal replication initiator protein